MTTHTNTTVYMSLGIVLMFFTNIVQGAEYWVTKQGNNANGCTNNSADACLSIQKGISILMPGDTLNIEQGTYIENSFQSLYTEKCIWLDGDPVSLCFNRSGTLSNPITVRAAPGHEGNVVVDSELKRLGMQLNSHDYIVIRDLRIINNLIAGIATWGQPENRIADESKLSIGVRVENNYIYNTNGKFGKNIAGIHMWGSKDWVVRNNFIDYVTRDGALASSHTSGIQAYGTINALVEHNYVSRASVGILWKDHFVADEVGTPIFESEIRYNVLNTDTDGVAIIGYDEAGFSYIHHNIIYGYRGTGIIISLARALDTSKGLRIEHNLLDGSGISKTIGISNDAYIDHRMSGNIIIRNQSHTVTGPKAKLVASNYNIFTINNTYSAVMDRYAPSAKVYSTLNKWKAALSSESLSLSVNKPDSNSIEVSPAGLFRDIANRDYRYFGSSPARGFMPDNSNAGPYQYENEIIGLLPSGFKQPSQASNLTVTMSK